MTQNTLKTTIVVLAAMTLLATAPASAAPQPPGVSGGTSGVGPGGGVAGGHGPRGHGTFGRGPGGHGHGGRGPGGHGPMGAGPGPGEPGFAMARLHHLLTQLDLDTSQREEIRALVEAGREANEDLLEELAERRRAQRDALWTDVPDEAAIRAGVLASAELEAELAVRGARLMAEVLAVLTPEQRERGDELVERARERRPSHRPRWRGGR